MPRRENRDYGKIIDYDPQWKGPLQIEREQTDFGFLISLGVYFAVWISTGIYAFCTGDIKNGGGNHRGTDRLDIDSILSPSAHSNVISIALGFIILGLFLSFAYLFLLRHYPKAVVFTGIFVTLAFLGVSIGVLAYVMANGTQRDSSNAIFGLVTCVVLFIVMVVCLIAFRKKIVIACGVIKESTKAVIFFPSSFVFPILPIILYGITLVFAGYTFTYLSANPSMRSSNTPIHIYLFHGINFFGMLWMLNFIYAFSQMVLSGTFATWYWTMDKEREVPSLAILKFMHVTTRFHLGTLAFGSLIIAIVEAIKALLRSLTQRSQDSGNDMAALCFRCFGCLCGAVENFLEYINSNAYIMCTIHGTKFIQSAKDAFNLLMRNAMSVVAITNVTGAILLLGELIVVGLSVLATYLYCRNMGEDVMYAAVGIVFISTLLMSVSIFEVLKTAINTIFLCVLEDYERNDGSSERPYFMPYKLRQLLIHDS